MSELKVGKYQAYPEYKDSGIEWIGGVPIHWKSASLSKIFSIKAGGDVKNEFFSEEKTAEHPYPIYTNANDEKSIYGYTSKCNYPPNTITVSGRGEVGFAVYRDHAYDAIIRLLVLSPTGESHGKFFAYFINKVIDFRVESSAIGQLSTQQIAPYQVTFPSFDEQQNIANFLDHETAKIDTLIEKQQQLIKLLKEKRQAVISHTVTKGLNPQTPMKDSGVEWLGGVPEHWDIFAVSKLSQKITNGYVGPTRDILVPYGVSYVQATHIKKGKVNFDNAYFVRQQWSDKHTKSILKKGDVLIVQTGAGTGDIGLVTENEEGFNCHALIIVQPKNDIISGDYLSLVFQSQYGYSVLYSIRTGGMHPHLNCGEVQFVKIPIPPRAEQDQITEYINQQAHKFDTLVEKQLKAIELMQERRTALISAAVTGKIDVRHWKQPNDE